MSESHTLILLGGGGHAAVVCEAAIAAGWTIAGYLDDRGDQNGNALPGGIPRLGAIADRNILPAGASIHAAVGDAALRRAWLTGIDVARIATIIHPSAVISPSATIEEGVFIGPRAAVNARARIQRGAIVNTGAIIEHDCTLEPFCHVAPGAVLAGNVTIGAECLIGAGAVVCPSRHIGPRTTLGAGTVAVDDLPGGVTAVGAPARPIAAAAPQVAG